MATDRIALPTENYEPYYRSLKEFDRIVEENSEILARIATIIDVNLTYPDIPPIENARIDESHEVIDLDSSVSSLRSDANIAAELDAPSSRQNASKVDTMALKIYNDKDDDSETQQKRDAEKPEQDNLREYLDNVLLLGSTPMDVPQLDTIKSDRVRQLLQDNFKLARLHKIQKKRNQEFVKIISEYELLLARVILPRLSKQISSRNLKMIEDFKSKVLPQRNERAANIWSKHVEYVENLGRLEKLTNSLAGVAGELIELPQLDRLGAQLAIVENLMDYSVKKDQVQEYTRGDHPTG